jgi:hypothetical protein
LLRCLGLLRWLGILRRLGVLRTLRHAFLFSLFRQLVFQCSELFKAHDAVYDEENAWIVAVRPESDIYAPGASLGAVRVVATNYAPASRWAEPR